MTILWNEVTIWCNEVTKGWNEVVWNEVVMERNDWIPMSRAGPVSRAGVSLPGSRHFR